MLCPWTLSSHYLGVAQKVLKQKHTQQRISIFVSFLFVLARVQFLYCWWVVMACDRDMCLNLTGKPLPLVLILFLPTSRGWTCFRNCPALTRVLTLNLYSVPLEEWIGHGYLPAGWLYFCKYLKQGWLFDLEVKLWFQELGHKILKSFAGTSRGTNFHSGWQVLFTKNDHNSIHLLYFLYVYEHKYICTLKQAYVYKTYVMAYIFMYLCMQTFNIYLCAYNQTSA